MWSHSGFVFFTGIMPFYAIFSVWGADMLCCHHEQRMLSKSNPLSAHSQCVNILTFWIVSLKKHILSLSSTIYISWTRSITLAAGVKRGTWFPQSMSTCVCFIHHSSYCTPTSRCEGCCFIYDTDCLRCAALPELELCFEANAWCECMMFHHVLTWDILAACFLNWPTYQNQSECSLSFF